MDQKPNDQQDLNQSVSPVSFEPSSKSGSKAVMITVVILVIIIAVAAVYIVLNTETSIPDANVPQGVQVSGALSVSSDDDSIPALNNEIESIDIGDLESEFNSIDADINQL